MENTNQHFQLLWQLYLDGKASKAQLNELMDLLEQMPVNQQTDQLMSTVEKQLQQSWEQPDAIVQPSGAEVWVRMWKQIRTRTGIPHSPSILRLIPRYWAAAAILLLVAASIWYFIPGEKIPVSSLAKAPEASLIRVANKIITLPDGTTVTLKADAQIKQEVFNDQQRVVSLQGEAFFDVHHDPKRPFLVRAQNINIRVLGTAFLVSAIPGKTVTVKVTRGKVAVSTNEALLGVLTPAQSVTYDPVNQTHELNLQADTTGITDEEKVKEWRWREATLTEVISWLEQHYDVKIALADTSLERSRFTASFRDPVLLEDILEVIRELYRVQVIQSDQKHYRLVSPDNRH